jgi:Protein of unknown function (DUF3455)
MKRRFLAGLAAAAAVTASVVMVSGADAATPDATAAAQSAGVTSSGNVPVDIQVPAGYKIVASLRGVGKQIYDCSPGGAFTFREPAAGLFTSRGVPAAIHGKGPSGPFWTNFDGSRVDGAVLKSVPSPDPAPPAPAKNIPWLKLAATPTGATGVFSHVEFIQRIDTRGGVAPAGTCSVPTTVAVDYTANYVFWAK